MENQEEIYERLLKFAKDKRKEYSFGENKPSILIWHLYRDFLIQLSPYLLDKELMQKFEDEIDKV